MASSSRKVAWFVVALSFVAISGFALLTSSANSVTIRVSVFGDTYVSTTYPTTAYGGASVIWVSKAGSAESWGLISFNAASKIAGTPTATVVSARIMLLVNQSFGTFPALMVTGRLLADFSEASATYNTAPAATFATSTATLFSKQPMPGFAVFVDVTKQLMAWLSSGQRTNFGLMLKMDSATANAGIAFASRENPFLGGPVLQVFTLPPGLY